MTGVTVLNKPKWFHDPQNTVISVTTFTMIFITFFQQNPFSAQEAEIAVCFHSPRWAEVPSVCTRCCDKLSLPSTCPSKGPLPFPHCSPCSEDECGVRALPFLNVTHLTQMLPHSRQMRPRKDTESNSAGRLLASGINRKNTHRGNFSNFTSLRRQYCSQEEIQK